MHRYLLPTVVAIVWTGAPAVPNDEQDCFQGMEPQLRIAGCSKLIRRNPNDAAVYHNRGVAYDLVDRKSTRLNSSHTVISYAVFCLKKKKKQKQKQNKEKNKNRV